jgi:hypothetical protein
MFTTTSLPGGTTDGWMSGTFSVYGTDPFSHGIPGVVTGTNGVVVSFSGGPVVTGGKNSVVVHTIVGRVELGVRGLMGPVGVDVVTGPAVVPGFPEVDVSSIPGVVFGTNGVVVCSMGGPVVTAGGAVVLTGTKGVVVCRIGGGVLVGMLVGAGVVTIFPGVVVTTCGTQTTICT